MCGRSREIQYFPLHNLIILYTAWQVYPESIYFTRRTPGKRGYGTQIHVAGPSITHPNTENTHPYPQSPIFPATDIPNRSRTKTLLNFPIHIHSSCLSSTYNVTYTYSLDFAWVLYTQFLNDTHISYPANHAF